MIHPKGSRERAAVRDIAARQHVHPPGRRRSLSEHTLQRHLDAYETRGDFAELGRAKRSDAGASRVILTRGWDTAVPFDLPTKERIGAVIGLTDETAAIAARITETGTGRAERKRCEAEAEQDRIDREAREENEIARKYAAKHAALGGRR